MNGPPTLQSNCKRLSHKSNGKAEPALVRPVHPLPIPQPALLVSVLIVCWENLPTLEYCDKKAVATQPLAVNAAQWSLFQLSCSARPPHATPWSGSL